MKAFLPVAAFAALAISATVRANDVDPFGFEKEHFASTKSRAEVVADLKQAQAAGQLPIPGELGVRFADAPSTKPRAQVVAETIEARRLGLISYGEVGPREATQAEEQRIHMAGIRALERLAAAKRTSAQTGG